MDVVWITVDAGPEPADDVGGGNGAAKRGVAGNVELAEAIGSNADPGGGVGLGVVVGVVTVGRGLQRKNQLVNIRIHSKSVPRNSP